jgi:cell wall-associated NlpC family hydrolase
VSTTSFDPEQEANAQTIIAVGRAVGASDRDIQIALATALQESGLKNINYGDAAGPDSLGLFQQRAPWGSAADRMNPAQSALMFFKGGQGGQRGLLSFKNRDQLSLTQAAQAVQVSAFPDAYAKWSGAAAALLGANPAPTTTTPAAATGATGATEPTTQPGQATTALGAGAVGALGAGAVTGQESAGVAGPSAAGVEGPVTQAPTGPTQPNQTLSYEQFNALFPDAAANQTFTGALSKVAAAKRQDVVSTALSYLGTPYVWGGTSPTSGVDCSGLVQDVYKSFGVDLPRLSADQIRAGTAVPYNQLQPGDLIGWDINSRNNGADHIAIYAGNGMIIEAPRPGLSVRIRQLDPQEIKTALGAHFAELG